MCGPRSSGTRRTTLRPRRAPSRSCREQCTIVNVAARSLTNAPTGSVQSPSPLAVVRDALLEFFGRRADGERQQPEAVLADLVVAFETRRRAPDRRVRLLQRLRVHVCASASTSTCPRTRTRRASRCRRCVAALRPTSRASRAGRCRSLRSRRASTTGRCRTRRGRRSRGRAPPRSPRCGSGGCTASAAAARRSRCGCSR